MPRRNQPAQPTTKPPRLRGIVSQRALELPAEIPELRARSVSEHPFLYRKMLPRDAGAAAPGDLVRVVDKQGEPVGTGLYNPRSKIAFRRLTRGDERPDAAWWRQRLADAVSLRRDTLGLERVTNAYRVVHAEADGLPGLVADRFADVLSVEVFSLGIFQRIEAIVAQLQELLGTRHSLVHADAVVQAREGFRASPVPSPDLPARVEVREHGLQFHVDLQGGHKTGFFCDQRDNRWRLGQLCEDRRVLDLCCYSGGFALHAAAAGARSVTAVDLDEKAVAVARDNARRNRARVSFVHADVFDFLREHDGQRWDVVVLDPPRLIQTRSDAGSGRSKYFDFNRLALGVVERGGVLLTCSCSGLMQEDDLLRLVRAAARQTGPGGDAERELQILARSGAAPDHPVAPGCPETGYLKAFWLRVL